MMEPTNDPSHQVLVMIAAAILSPQVPVRQCAIPTARSRGRKKQPNPAGNTCSTRSMFARPGGTPALYKKGRCEMGTIDHLVTTMVQLEGLYGEKLPASVIKEIDRINDSYRRLIEAAPFVIVATSG